MVIIPDRCLELQRVRAKEKVAWYDSRMGIKVEALNLNHVHRWLIIRPQLSNLRRPVARCYHIKDQGSIRSGIVEESTP